MKKHYLLAALLTIFLFVATNVWAFSDVDTHPKITKVAAAQSILTTYLNDFLGFKKGLNEAIIDTKTEQIIMDGAQTEDSGILNPGWTNLKKYKTCSRGLNHFFDPTYAVNDLNASLNDLTFSGFSNPIWATGPTYSAFTSIEDDPDDDAQWSNQKNEYSWSRARKAFFTALTAKTDDDRNRLLARTFRSVGQVAHLIQDMAVPAHVRNDMLQGHTDYQGINDYYFWNLSFLGNNFEAYVKRNPGLINGSEDVSFPYLRDFWDTDVYASNGSIYNSMGGGLAEYTNANFLSEYRLLDEDGYGHPATTDGSWVVTTVTAEDSVLDHRIYFNKTEGERTEHLAANGFLHKYVDGVRQWRLTDLLARRLGKAERAQQIL